MRLLLTLFSVFLVVSAIIREDSDSDCFSSSSSSSSESDERRHKHHHRPSPPRPRPPPPPPPPTPAPVPKCESGWIVSPRPQGDWCIKVGLVNLEYAGAEAACVQMGATLTGVQNAWERMTIANEALRIVTPMGLDRCGIWLGIQRITGTKGFRWTDGHTVGTDGYKWGPMQPDDSPVRGHQNCAQIVAMSPAYWTSGRTDFYRNFQNGDMDDIYCTGQWLPPTKMYACGKLPA